MVRKSTAKKRQFWDSHIEAWQQSGMARKSYCLNNNIVYDQFNYHYSRYQKEITSQPSIKESEPAQFITFNVEPDSSQATYALSQFKVSLTNGATFEWSAPWGPNDVASFIDHWSAS